MKNQPTKANNNITIGIDLDNTIICYDHLLQRLAIEKGYFTDQEIRPGLNKKIIRDRVRRSAGGDLEWQKLQALIYTELITDAKLFPGIDLFFSLARSSNAHLYLVSHKTVYARLDSGRTPLRETAMKWLQAQGFFDDAGFGLTRDQVFFEATRAAKISKLVELGCTHFVDDLIELFLEPDFPEQIIKIIFDPDGQQDCREVKVSNLEILRSWKEIAAYFFQQK